MTTRAFTSTNLAKLPTSRLLARVVGSPSRPITSELGLHFEKNMEELIAYPDDFFPSRAAGFDPLRPGKAHLPVPDTPIS